MPHESYMRRCLDLAQAGRGNTAPNPMVGAVLVYEDRIIGAGWHERYGSRHAEVACLDSVQPEDRPLIPMSRMYVSLEPCVHHGHTPPCADRLIKEGIRSVVVASTDPSEKVAGKGIALLRQHGVEVITDVLATEADWLNRRFICFHQRKRPYIILKWAQTADGYLAPSDRSRLQISNTHSRQLVHKWRTEESAIMVGYHTAMHDNPQLTARVWEGRQPLRIVADRDLELPSSLHLFDNTVPTWVLNTQREGEEGTVRYVRVPFDDQLLPTLMERLYAAHRISLIVEGGASLLRKFMGKGLWDEARVFTGPQLLGQGIPAPQIPQGEQILQTPLGSDLLQVVVNPASGFAVSKGMDL
jgi:diaminohydroxyphosphoribosylaminopyrimidine deaminase/5-amino-6-(5-phosphoribosylamino)uracil reductase